MNKYREKLIVPVQLCSIVLLTLFVVASVRAQTAVTAPTNDDLCDTTNATPFLRRFPPSFTPSGLRLMPPAETRTNIDQMVIKEFDKAWFQSACGTNGREGVVLIFRTADGSYDGKSQGFTNEYKRFTLRWNPRALAIVHTHPNDCDPRPSEQDKRVADTYHVPNFTIAKSGMYVYDPDTKKTSKVLNGLDWRNLSSYRTEFKRWLGASAAPPFNPFSESGYKQNPTTFEGNNCQIPPPLSQVDTKKGGEL